MKRRKGDGGSSIPSSIHETGDSTRRIPSLRQRELNSDHRYIPVTHLYHAHAGRPHQLKNSFRNRVNRVKIILGSSSPRRKEILSKIIDTFDICIPHVDEEIVEGENPRDYSNRVATEKIEYLRRVIPPGDEPCLIISCDTVVTIDNMVIGKPRDYADATAKIEMLSGKTHHVISSISLALAREGEQTTGSEITEVTFKNLGRHDIQQYLNSIDYRDKAGAYALQENGELIIEEIHGSITNVIGFPLRLFFRLLSHVNIVEAVFLPTADNHPGA